MIEETNDHLLTLSGALRYVQYSVSEIATLTTIHGFPAPVDQCNGVQPLYSVKQLENWRRFREQQLKNQLF